MIGIRPCNQFKSEATEQIKAKAYERSDERTNSRNGYRVRQLTTRVGSLELHVPKLRHGNFSTQSAVQTLPA